MSDLAEPEVDSKEEVKRADRVLYYHDLQLNNTEIAKILGCTKENVRQILKRNGLHSHVCWNINRERE